MCNEGPTRFDRARDDTFNHAPNGRAPRPRPRPRVESQSYVHPLVLYRVEVAIIPTTNEDTTDRGQEWRSRNQDSTVAGDASVSQRVTKYLSKG